MSGGGGEHSPHVAHHFDTATQQEEAGKLGMWLFLVTEILLFGGLFCWYIVARANHPELFYFAHHFLDRTLGGINTIVLISSSLTMAFAVRAAQLGRTKQLVWLLAATLVFAGGFLGIKYTEYTHKIHEGLLWGTHFDYGKHGAPEEAAPPAGDAEPPAEAPAEPAAPGEGPEGTTLPPVETGPEGLADPAGKTEERAPPRNLHLFFGIYFVMTGLHGLHVLAGMAVIFWLLLRARKGEFGPQHYLAVDLGGLYWHLVDIIWIFLFPLLYLIH